MAATAPARMLAVLGAILLSTTLAAGRNLKQVGPGGPGGPGGVQIPFLKGPAPPLPKGPFPPFPPLPKGPFPPLPTGPAPPVPADWPVPQVTPGRRKLSQIPDPHVPMPTDVHLPLPKDAPPVPKGGVKFPPLPKGGVKFPLLPKGGVKFPPLPKGHGPPMPGGVGPGFGGWPFGRRRLSQAAEVLPGVVEVVDAE